MVWVLSVLVAALAYFCGCLDAGIIAGNFVFHRNLSRLGKGNVGFSNFRRIYGWKGFTVLFGIEAVIDLLPILIGSIFFSTLKVKNVDTALIGRALAGYCLTVGRLWPYTKGFHGRSGAFALLFTAFGISIPVGFTVVVGVAAGFAVSRMFSVAALAGAVVFVGTTLLAVDERLAVNIVLILAGLVLLRHIPSIYRIRKKTEPQLSFQEDISYKFDEKF